MIGHIGTQDCRNRKRAKKHIVKNSKLPLAATSACLGGGGVLPPLHCALVNSGLA